MELTFFFLLQDRLGPLPTTTAGFNTAVSAAVAAAAASRDLSAIVPTTTHGFFTNFHNSTQQQHVTPPSTPGLVSVAAPSTVSSHEPLFTISDHFVNSSTTSASGNSFQLSTVNGNINHALTTIQGRKMNENSLVVRQISFWDNSVIIKRLWNIGLASQQRSEKWSDWNSQCFWSVFGLFLNLSVSARLVYSFSTKNLV